MRIVAGRYRGKTLSVPDGKNTRPTADRARESVFNVLDSRLRASGRFWSDLKAADVFAGTGAMGLEAVSRGVTDVVFMENDAQAMRCLRQNAQTAERDGVKISFLSDVFRAAAADGPRDLIFSDAPYGKNLTMPALTVLIEKGYIRKGTECVIECEKTEKTDFGAVFTVGDCRIYGRAAFYFLTY